MTTYDRWGPGGSIQTKLKKQGKKKKKKLDRKLHKKIGKKGGIRRRILEYFCLPLFYDKRRQGGGHASLTGRFIIEQSLFFIITIKNAYCGI